MLYADRERERRVTLRTIEALNENRVPYLIVTKSDLVALSPWRDAIDPSLAHIQVSLTCTDDERAKTYEKAVPPTKRLWAVEELHRSGFDVALRLSPFIPQFIDFDKLAETDCDKILVEFLRVNHWIRQWFDLDYTEYSLKYGGYDHLPLERKVEYLKQIKGFSQISVCEDVPEHWEYWKTHVNPNPDDCCNLRL